MCLFNLIVISFFFFFLHLQFSVILSQKGLVVAKRDTHLGPADTCNHVSDLIFITQCLLKVIWGQVNSTVYKVTFDR